MSSVSNAAAPPDLTKDEDPTAFAARISDPRIRALVRDFGPPEVQKWAIGLEQTLLTGSSGRVFPVGMKASPLLRAGLLLRAADLRLPQPA